MSEIFKIPRKLIITQTNFYSNHLFQVCSNLSSFKTVITFRKKKNNLHYCHDLGTLYDPICLVAYLCKGIICNNKFTEYPYLNHIIWKYHAQNTESICYRFSTYFTIHGKKIDLVVLKWKRNFIIWDTLKQKNLLLAWFVRWFYVLIFT